MLALAHKNFHDWVTILTLQMLILVRKIVWCREMNGTRQYKAAYFTLCRYIPKTTQSATRTTSNGTRNSRGFPPVSRLSQPTQPPAPTRPDPPALTRPDPPYKKPSAAPQRPPPPSIPSLRPPPPAASPSPLTQNNNPGTEAHHYSSLSSRLSPFT